MYRDDHEDALREHYLWVDITVEGSSNEIEYADMRLLDKKFSTRSLCEKGAAELAKLVEKELQQRQDIKHLTSGDSWVMYLAPIGHDFIYGVSIKHFGIVTYNYLCLPHNMDPREKK